MPHLKAEFLTVAISGFYRRLSHFFINKKIKLCQKRLQYWPLMALKRAS